MVNLFFFSNINSYYQKALFQSLFSFKSLEAKFSKQNLNATLLFQCNFLQVVGFRLSKL